MRSSRASTHWTSSIPTLALLAALLPTAHADDSATIQAALDVSKFQIRSIDVPTWNGGDLTIVTDLGSGPVALALSPHSLRSDVFQVIEAKGGTERVVQVPAPRTLKGQVFELVGSSTELGSVRASLLDDGLWARIETEDGKVFGIQPLASVLDAAPRDAHVIYEKSDVIPGDWKCGVDGLTLRGVSTQLGAAPQAGLKGTAFRSVEIACDTDFEFFQKNSSNVTTTTFDIENVLNTVEGIYENEVQITFEITTIIVRSDVNDPYTLTAGDLLDEFRNYWIANYGAIKRDQAHHFSGKNWAGGVIGVAYLSGVCNNLGYGTVESKFTNNFTQRTSLSAHEMGHNWSAQHCDGQGDCGIMCSGLGGCTGQLTQFGVSETNQIVNYKNGHTSCLPTLPDSNALPFSDNFPSTALDGVKWVYSDGAVINTAATAEPSSPNSLNLDSVGAGDFDDDEIRSGFILAAGSGNISLSYKVSRIGVESGETLTVQYWSNTLAWVTLNTITSDGINPAAFSPFSHVLPAAAKHNELRIRFRVNGNETNDDWYIDDVAITVPAAAPPTITGITPNPAQVQKDVIKITGTNFTGANQVNIGADILTAGSFSILDDATIELPGYLPSSLGAKSVTVTNSQGTSPASSVTLAPCSPPLFIVPAVTNSLGTFDMVAAGQPGAQVFFVVNLSFTTFTFNGATWLSPLVLIPFGSLDSIGYMSASIPMTGVPGGLPIYTQQIHCPPGSDSGNDCSVTNIGSTLNLF